MNKWHEFMENGVRYKVFADNISLWTTGKKVTDVEDKIQRELD